MKTLFTPFLLRLLILLCISGASTLRALSVLPTPGIYTAVPRPEGQADDITQATVIACDPRFDAEAEVFARQLRFATGYPLPIVHGTQANIRILFDQDYPESAYSLDCLPTGTTLRTSTRSGAFYGMQTLLQLLPAAIMSPHPCKDVPWRFTYAKIKDSPRLPHRGLLIDEARHFFGVEAIKRQLSAMAVAKLNVLHWHLTDNQGWRIEIKKYPQLTAIGAKRASSPQFRNHTASDETPYGPFYYTQAQIRDIIAYAAERHITIIPEIDLPGHTLALLAAMPELSCTGGPFEVRPTWGRESNTLCPGNDQAYTVATEILQEVMDLFPSEKIVIGGDEIPHDKWEQCPKCQARLRELGLTTYDQLQGWFTQRFSDYVLAQGRTPLIWDDAVATGYPISKANLVLGWRGWAGAPGGKDVIRQGYRTILCPTNICYIDHGQGYADDPYEYAPGGNVPIQNILSYDLHQGLRPSQYDLIQGVQGNLWTEYCWDPRELEWKLWPRALAIAQLGWSQQGAPKPDRSAFRNVTDRLRLRGMQFAPDTTLYPASTK